MSVLYTILGIVVVLVIWGVFAYNSLVQQKNWVKEAWAQIDVQLQRRNDLIPNLVETVKGYAKHEQETLSQVIAMRNQIAGMGNDVSPQEKMDASNQLSGALKTVFALAESYPDLKANTNFLNLQIQKTKFLILVNCIIQVLRNTIFLLNLFQQTLLLDSVDLQKKNC